MNRDSQDPQLRVVTLRSLLADLDRLDSESTIYVAARHATWREGTRANSVAKQAGIERRGRPVAPVGEAGAAREVATTLRA